MPALQVYASWIVATTVATNWVVLALSASLGVAANCDPLVVNGTTAEVLAVACSPDTVFALLGATTAAVLLSVAVFLGSIERGHVGSFFRPMTYQQQVSLHFQNHYTKEEQVELITCRDPVYWTSVEAVQVFIASHWAEWEADPPAWFADPRWRAALPEECLPDKEAQQAAHLQQTA